MTDDRTQARLAELRRENRALREKLGSKEDAEFWHDRFEAMMKALDGIGGDFHKANDRAFRWRAAFWLAAAAGVVGWALAVVFAIKG